MTVFAKVFQRLDGESNDEWAKRIAESIAEDSTSTPEEEFHEEEEY